jgi:hypothetical protein
MDGAANWGGSVELWAGFAKNVLLSGSFQKNYLLVFFGRCKTGRGTRSISFRTGRWPDDVPTISPPLAI